MSIQWPVMIQSATIIDERACARNSGSVNFPKIQQLYFLLKQNQPIQIKQIYKKKQKKLLVNIRIMKKKLEHN